MKHKPNSKNTYNVITMLIFLGEQTRVIKGN